MFGNASPLEWAWLAVAALGIFAALIDTYRAALEVRIHWHDAEGPYRGIAISSACKSVLLLAMTLLGLWVGVIAMGTPEPVREPLQEYQEAVATILMVYQALLVLVILIKDWERWYVSLFEWVARKRAPQGCA